MPTRRTHNKTRLGCHQCKKRRIKCDVKHPTCANCEKREFECSFLLLAPSTRLSTTATPPASSPAKSTLSSTSTQLTVAPKTPKQFQESILTPNAATPSSSSCSSLYLVLPQIPGIPRYIRWNDVWKETREILTPELHSMLYHYDQSTSQTLATDAPAKVAWQSFVPGLTSQHQYLIHSLLSVASLHLGHLHKGKEEKKTMMIVAASQMNKALARYSRELENVNKTNAAALFASATFTALYFIRASAVEMEEIRDSVPAGTIEPHPGVVDRMINTVIKVFFGLRGTVMILGPGKAWVIGDGEMEAVVTRYWWPTHRVPAGERAAGEDRRLCQLERLWMCPGRDYEPHFEHLKRALSCLRDVYALVSQLTLPGGDSSSMHSVPYAVDDTTVGLLKDRGAIFIWVTELSREFIGLVQNKNREALVLLAHFAVLLGRVRSVWWLEGIGANMIMAAAMGLGRENWHLIEWPSEVVGVDLENIFGGVSSDGLEAKLDKLHMGTVEKIR
ncbi:hypothetical protein K469DRAFT_742685 [Zopfia rhizophila CBS 207.26]|uniref:Zn(2)-C6 fungal-type domain-containing protein n=1 Tax=Zopfia rhizophila CBS 207.26 TaxID=1314779 RepID=A0A6A6DF32_9PEZI|nr:hypothetical protein K469DRAFT_742685 [Zopfia rhizophila CBS 207.26]